MEGVKMDRQEKQLRNWKAVAATFVAISFLLTLVLVIAGVFTSSVKNLKKFSNVTDKLVKASGWLIILVSLYLFYKVFSPLV